ncbi:MAG: UDP-glucose 4-epimerase GalE [Bacteroidales bacterium]|nr:UDP-glucose 4-epimerase GalE [Bacteroidales bacterium]
MTKILVTGGAGFIGSHTTVELQQQGYTVLIADNLSNTNAGVVDNIEKITSIRPLFEKVDLSVQTECAALFERHPDIEGVINFAAHKAVGESVEKPLMYYRNNLCIVLNVLNEMQRRGIKNFVQSSSCTVYGEPDQLPITETAPLKPALAPYGNTKKMVEDILQDCAKQDLVHAIALRYFNPIGAHPSALIGELPNGVPNNLMPFITQTAAGIREQLSVFGNDYNTPDGTCIRDYIHVVDLAKSHVAALRRLLQNEQKAHFETFNIGTGNGFSVLQVIQSFEKMSGRKLNYRIADRREGDIEKIWADTSYSNHELGWHAEQSLDDMTRDAWRWQLHLMES